MVLGFFAFTTFILFTVGSLIHDDACRHKDLEKRISQAVDQLKGKYGCDDKEVERLLQEFETLDAAEQAGDDGKEKTAMEMH